MENVGAFSFPSIIFYVVALSLTIIILLLHFPSIAIHNKHKTEQRQYFFIDKNASIYVCDEHQIEYVIKVQKEQ